MLLRGFPSGVGSMAAIRLQIVEGNMDLKRIQSGKDKICQEL
jgi:hypothetical protein